MSPPAPQPAYFDAECGAWVLSRYADVLGAFRHPCVWPIAARGKDQAKTRDEIGRLRVRPQSLEALSAARVAEWQARAEPLARSAAARLATDRPVDLLTEFALPWCFEVALMVLQADPRDSARLEDLGARVFAATGAPDGSELRPIAAEATAELERIFQDGPMPMGEPTFVAISQTLPRLLANIWMALLENPDELTRLRARPSLLPGCVEELLRHAGIVRRVWRQALADLELGGVKIAAGERILLMLASANRDPAQFPEPDRLDLDRSVTGQLALGSGRNSCVGNLVIRMGVAVSTAALLAEFHEIELYATPEWRVGSGDSFPTSVPVRLRKTSARVQCE
jgi:cytochrome P450